MYNNLQSVPPPQKKLLPKSFITIQLPKLSSEISIITIFEIHVAVPGMLVEILIN